MALIVVLGPWVFTRFSLLHINTEKIAKAQDIVPLANHRLGPVTLQNSRYKDPHDVDPAAKMRAFQMD